MVLSSIPRYRLPEYWIPDDLGDVIRKNENYFNRNEKSDQYLLILNKLKNLDHLKLAQCHYLQFLKLGLYLEEFQTRNDLRMFNVYGKKIEKVNFTRRTFKIHLDHIDKDNPLQKSCIRLIEVYNPKDKHTKFTFRVKEVTESHIVADAYQEFCICYNPDTLYDVRLRINNYPYRCNHYALSLINLYKLTSSLFPTKQLVAPEKILLNESVYKWFDQKIMDNPEQKKAVINIINKTAYPAPYILYGPPGTGKTATLAEAVTQIWSKEKDNVIICTPSNAAADEITIRLLQCIPDKDVYRIYGLSRDCSLIDNRIKLCSNYSGGRIQKLNPNCVSNKKIIISTLNTCCKLLFMELKTKYSYVFIDEAGQSPEPESLIAFNMIIRHGNPACQVVLLGDPQQLGPCIRSKYAAPILGQSILERLMKTELYEKINNNEYDSDYITKLVRNYRSHPAIIRVSNELYYDNELIACSNKESFVNDDFKSEFPIVFHAVNGEEQKDKTGTSSYNEEEIRKVMEYVRLFLGEKIGNKEISQSDIGIVTPFLLQSKNLREALQKESFVDVAVGTVETFQGQEKEIIIISAVRSKIFVHEDRKHIGFLSNPRRFNVALTRAKSNLVVIGNPTALQADENWYHFLKFCRDNNACRGEKFELIDGIHRLYMLMHATNLGKVCEDSLDLFPESFKILPIDDGILREKRNRHLFNGSYYNERKCTIL